MPVRPSGTRAALQCRTRSIDSRPRKALADFRCNMRQADCRPYIACVCSQSPCPPYSETAILLPKDTEVFPGSLASIGSGCANANFFLVGTKEAIAHPHILEGICGIARNSKGHHFAPLVYLDRHVSSYCPSLTVTIPTIWADPF